MWRGTRKENPAKAGSPYLPDVHSALTALSWLLLSGIPLATLSRLTAWLSGSLLTASTRTLAGLVLLTAALLLLLALFVSVLLVHHFLHSHHDRKRAFDTEKLNLRPHLPRGRRVGGENRQESKIPS